MRYEAVVVAVVLVFTGPVSGAMTTQGPGVEIILDFRTGPAGDWYAVNDGVMGGRSSSTMRSSEVGSAVFEGDLSLENNGGFASVRTDIAEGALAESTRLVLRVRGDGKRYQLRLRTSTAFDGIAYGAVFETVADEWTTVELPFNVFEPTFRGYRPRNAAPLRAAEIRQIGIMLTDKQEGRFRLEVAWIGADRAGGAR